MTIADKLLLGANTTMIGMGIVFIVLVALWGIIVAQSKLISFFSKKVKRTDTADLPTSVDKEGKGERTGITSGELVVLGVTEDDVLALIMTVVSHYADIPLNSLKFKSIKAL